MYKSLPVQSLVVHQHPPTSTKMLKATSLSALVLLLPALAQAASPLWGQCGGNNWSEYFTIANDPQNANPQRSW